MTNQDQNGGKMITYEVWAAEPYGFSRSRLIFREGELGEALVSADRFRQIGKKFVRIEKVTREIVYPSGVDCDCHDCQPE